MHLTFTKGHLSAFQQLYEMHHEALYRYIVSIVQYEPEAKKIVNFAFLKLWCNYSQMHTATQISGYLNSSAKKGIAFYFSRLLRQRQQINNQKLKLLFGCRYNRCLLKPEDSFNSVAILTRLLYSTIPLKEVQSVIQLAFIKEFDDETISYHLSLTVSAVLYYKNIGVQDISTEVTCLEAGQLIENMTVQDIEDWYNMVDTNALLTKCEDIINNRHS